MTDPKRLLKAQAGWQKSLARLPWPEKVRMVEAMRPAILALRKKAAPPSHEEGHSTA